MLQCVLNVDEDDGALGAAAGNCRKIEPVFRCELARRRRCPDCIAHGQRLRGNCAWHYCRLWSSGPYACHRMTRRCCNRLTARRRADHGQRCSDRDRLSERHQKFFDHARLEHLDFDRAFLRLDDGHDIAVLDCVAGRFEPLDEFAGLHIGTERGHAELAHQRPSAVRAAATIVGVCGNAASSRCLG